MDESLNLASGIRRLTVNLDDQDVKLFEGTWPVPHGVALHAYLVQGETFVIVDPWDAGGYGPEEVEADLLALGLGWKDIAAVVFTKPASNERVAQLLQARPGLEIWPLEAGARHELGEGVTLEEKDGFWFSSPSGVAFTGDAFAGLGWVEDELWTEDLGEHEARYFEDEALRWFSSRPLVPRLPPEARVVGPAHGCLWKSPEGALARARKFDDWGRGQALDEVTVVWPAGADHEASVDALVGGVLDTGAGLNLFRVPGDDVTALAAGARRASLVVLAEGLDPGFLSGLEKDLWRPPVSTPASELRSELVERYLEPGA